MLLKLQVQKWLVNVKVKSDSLLSSSLPMLCSCCENNKAFNVCHGQSKTSYFYVGKQSFFCWLTKALASCRPSRSTSRYSALILSLISPSSVAEVELREKCYREVKDNKMNRVHSQTQAGNAPQTIL